jgi:hypothetical protein
MASDADWGDCDDCGRALTEDEYAEGSICTVCSDEDEEVDYDDEDDDEEDE